MNYIDSKLWARQTQIRIVAGPGTGKMSAIALREHADVFKPEPLPEIRTRNDSLRYISVFEGKQVRLPISRVIAGPAAGAEDRIALVCSLRSERQRFWCVQVSAVSAEELHQFSRNRSVVFPNSIPKYRRTTWGRNCTARNVRQAGGNYARG